MIKRIIYFWCAMGASLSCTDAAWQGNELKIKQTRTRKKQEVTKLYYPVFWKRPLLGEDRQSLLGQQVLHQKEVGGLLMVDVSMPFYKLKHWLQPQKNGRTDVHIYIKVVQESTQKALLTTNFSDSDTLMEKVEALKYDASFMVSEHLVSENDFLNMLYGWLEEAFGGVSNVDYALRLEWIHDMMMLKWEENRIQPTLCEVVGLEEVEKDEDEGLESDFREMGEMINKSMVVCKNCITGKIVRPTCCRFVSAVALVLACTVMYIQPKAWLPF